MKKFLLAILLMLGIVPLSFAEKNKVKLEIKQAQNYKPTVHRAPMLLEIEAYYNATTQTIDILYDGEADGEVYLYLNNNMVDYSPEINISFPISAPGLYKIEVIGETWIAEGFLEV